MNHWIEGKIFGYILQTENAYVIYFKGKYENKWFYFDPTNQLSIDQAYQCATKWHIDFAKQHNLFYNMYKHIDNNTIVLKIDSETEMICDMIDKDILIKYIWCVEVVDGVKRVFTNESITENLIERLSFFDIKYPHMSAYFNIKFKDNNPCNFKLNNLCITSKTCESPTLNDVEVIELQEENQHLKSVICSLKSKCEKYDILNIQNEQKQVLLDQLEQLNTQLQKKLNSAEAMASNATSEKRQHSKYQQSLQKKYEDLLKVYNETLLLMKHISDKCISLNNDVQKLQECNKDKDEEISQLKKEYDLKSSQEMQSAEQFNKIVPYLRKTIKSHSDKIKELQKINDKNMEIIDKKEEQILALTKKCNLLDQLNKNKYKKIFDSLHSKYMLIIPVLTIIGITIFGYSKYFV